MIISKKVENFFNSVKENITEEQKKQFLNIVKSIESITKKKIIFL
jgi:hypothetical protein